jgi:hypothetical protein
MCPALFKTYGTENEESCESLHSIDKYESDAVKSILKREITSQEDNSFLYVHPFVEVIDYDGKIIDEPISLIINS